MTRAGPSDVRKDDQANRYERLRLAVHNHGIGHRLGLALFLRAGTKAWLDGWSECGTDPDRQRARAKGVAAPALPNALDGEVVRVLASMVLGRAHAART